MRRVLFTLAALVAFAPALRAQDPEAAERGKKALLTRAFIPATWKLDSYSNAWKHWTPAPKSKPENYDAAFREHYGLHAAPYENNGLPMGLRHGQMPLFGKGIALDCLLCHGGSIGGQSYIGLGNTALDAHAVFEEMSRATGIGLQLPFNFSNVRGTSEAGAFSVYLMAMRKPDLNMSLKSLDLKLQDVLCEDVPAWWLLKKKKTMYHSGNIDARGVRSLMQFALLPGNGPDFFVREEATFRDIQAYLLTLTPPKYPLSIDTALAAKGKDLFTVTCVKCHGTYGDNPAYPNKNVPINEIGTDKTRYEGFSKEYEAHYNVSWFGKEKATGGKDLFMGATPGYLAPPLDGIWATAPYLHNGSVPTLNAVLNSKVRPKIYTRSFRTDMESYDEVNVGWKVQELKSGADPKLPPIERRKVYDTTQPGRGNGGHTFGDAFSDEERRAVIEYLKTL